MKNKTPLYLLCLVLFCTLTVVVTLKVKSSRSDVPVDECSELFRRFAGTEGIEAAFIKDRRVNDTTCMDMTVLRARDSLTFAGLLKELKYRDQDIPRYIRSKGTSHISPKGHPERPMSDKVEDNDFYAIRGNEYEYDIFHIRNVSDQDIIMDIFNYYWINL